MICFVCIMFQFRYVKEFRLLSGEACYNIWLAIYQLFAGDDKLLFLFGEDITYTLTHL